MPVGLQVISNTGILQIDENYVNMSLITKASVTAVLVHPVIVGGTPLKYIDITYVGDTPLLAITGHGGVIACSRSGTAPNYTWVFRVVSWPVSGSYTFTYYIFDRPKVSATSGHIIESYAADGKLLFSSAYPIMKVAGMTNQVLPSGKTYAVVYTSNIFYTQETDVLTDMTVETTTIFRCYMARPTATGGTSGTTIIFSDVTEGGGGAYPVGSGDLGGWGLESIGLVIDVTGL